MKLRKLGTTDLEIAPLVLGGNVFGWTADRETDCPRLADGASVRDCADRQRYEPEAAL
jgi:aryl-alcohol dehydrogenase-like predicted oxidoreductase